MSRQASGIKTAPAGFATGRRTKAMQFADAAALFYDDATQIADLELRDAYVTLAVHAGIAAADTICATRLGRYYAGENHTAAAELLQTADPTAATALRRLLDLKTKAGYTAQPSSNADVKTAHDSVVKLLLAAQRV